MNTKHLLVSFSKIANKIEFSVFMKEFAIKENLCNNYQM